MLIGGNSNDILIGGKGADRIVGKYGPTTCSLQATPRTIPLPPSLTRP